jgi:predicted metal-dependent hydrolase
MLAAHHTQLGGHTVRYRLETSRRRSIGFVVDAGGLSVRAPKWVAAHEIELLLQQKTRWILQKLAQQHLRSQQQQSAKVHWHEGMVLPYLGQSVVVPLPVLQNTPPERIAHQVTTWLQHQALQHFTQRCQHFAPLLGVHPKKISLSSAKTRWGSASSGGHIRLNWRLIHFQVSTIDYVIAHELSHLLEMNHSARFWHWVRSVIPDVERARRDLKDTVLPVLD